MSDFSEKVILVTGGTGSFGNAVTRRLLQNEVAEVRILSRDEKKQDEMRKLYSDERVKFLLGDIRDRGSVSEAVSGVNYIFHAAALKQVPSCEFYPIQAVKTNVMGTSVVVDEAARANVDRLVCLSTDKAVYPINAMGMSKALMEKVVTAKSRGEHSTDFCVTRYGNVMASRGSVIPLFIDQIRAGKPITITDASMTRFMMTLSDAVELVLYALKNGRNGDTFVQKAPAATMADLAQAICNYMGVPNHPRLTIGIRHGEKIYESLLGSEEYARAKDLGDYFSVPVDARDLNYGLFVEGGSDLGESGADYNSHSTKRLAIPEIENLLESIADELT